MSERARLTRLAPLALGASAAALTWRWLSARPRPGAPYLAGAPLLIAHRGGAGLAPENTMTAFRQAVEWWAADILELDVHATRDGEVVVIHDHTVDRTTDGRGPVSGYSLGEIRRLDAGFRFTPGGGEFPYRGRDVRIPSLAEVLEAFPELRVNVEIKDARAQEPVRELVRELGAEHRVLVAAGKRANRERLRDYPGATSASEEELRVFFAHHLLHATALYHPPVDAFQMPERHGGLQLLSPRFVQEAHAKNVAIHVWTVDDAGDMLRLLRWGVDGIITDRPDRLARVLHDFADRPLPPGPPAGAAPPFLERLLLA